MTLIGRARGIARALVAAITGPQAVCGECLTIFIARDDQLSLGVRTPCPECSSTARVFMRSSTENFGAIDRTSARKAR